MSVIITMAGLGSRFKEVGYSLPKYKINAKGKTLLEWSLLSLNDYFEEHFVFATIGLEDADFLLEITDKIGIKNVTICPRKSLSKGQAETAYNALEAVDLRDTLWIYNIDTYVSKGLLAESIGTYDGCLPVFPSISSNMSFVRFDDAGRVSEVAEKQVISSWASVGLYGFKSADIFFDVYQEMYTCGTRSRLRLSEQYIAPMYSHMLKSGFKLIAPCLEESDVHILGTPDDLVNFAL